MYLIDNTKKCSTVLYWFAVNFFRCSLLLHCFKSNLGFLKFKDVCYL